MQNGRERNGIRKTVLCVDRQRVREGGTGEDGRRKRKRKELSSLALSPPEAADELQGRNTVKSFFKVVINFQSKRRSTALKAIAY